MNALIEQNKVQLRLLIEREAAFEPSLIRLLEHVERYVYSGLDKTEIEGEVKHLHEGIELLISFMNREYANAESDVLPAVKLSIQELGNLRRAVEALLKRPSSETLTALKKTIASFESAEKNKFDLIGSA